MTTYNTPSLLTLPVELRLKIYSHLQEPTLDLSRPRMKAIKFAFREAGITIALSRVNRQLRAEILSTDIRCLEIRSEIHPIVPWTLLEKWLWRATEEERTRVRSIKLMTWPELGNCCRQPGRSDFSIALDAAGSCSIDVPDTTPRSPNCCSTQCIGNSDFRKSMEAQFASCLARLPRHEHRDRGVFLCTRDVLNTLRGLYQRCLGRCGGSI